jgi:hypothetical protein
MTDNVKYPGVLAAVRQGEKAIWKIGDELIAALGNPPKSTVRDESRKKFEPVAEELLEHGYEYGVESLSKIRRTAADFPPSRRHPGVSFTAHQEAGSPDILDAILKATPKGTLISKRYIRAAKKGMFDEKSRETKAAHNKAKAAEKAAEKERERARQAQKDAKDEAERKAAAERERIAAEKAAAARQKAKDSQPPPEKKPPENFTPKKLADGMVGAEFSVKLKEAKTLLTKMTNGIEPIVDQLSQTTVESWTEQLLDIAETARKLADLIRRNQPTRRGHLYAVND